MKNITLKNNENSCSIEKIKLYKDIFGESPWEEGFICKNCNSIYSKKFMGKCDCSNSELEPFYKNDELKKEFNNIATKYNYSELVAKILNKNIGFVWGWNTSLSELNNDKFGLEQEKLEILKNNLLDNFGDIDLNNFYYFSEIGVQYEYRGNDIAGILYRENLEELKQRGEKYIVLRTTRKADLPYKWFKREGFIDVYEYLDEQDRVILVCKI